MAIQKKVNGAWQPINPKQLKGIPYTGTLPAVLTGTKAGYLHKYKIYGNLTQNGTPTPENPIVPQECGERTENLFDADSTHQGYYNNSGNFVANNKYICSQPILASEQNYTISAINSYTGGGYVFQLVYFNANDEYISLDSASLYGAGKKSLTGSVPSSATKIIAVVTSDSSECILVEGSTALPYEPYGYKLPLTSGSTPVDIYLGESQTTRRIKKLVLTGEETPASISQTTDGNNYCVAYKYSDLGMTDIINYDELTYLCPYPAFVSSHFTMKSIEGLPLPNVYNDIQPGQVGGNTWIPRIAGTPTYNRYIIFCVSGITTTNDFKAYLQQQYANGTPVTVWYVLAEPETGILNEPLRKIGDYADTIDSTQTSAQIPTTANSTTISWAGSGLAPSEFDSIQEWVNAQTYTRINGEWVADN